VLKHLLVQDGQTKFEDGSMDETDTLRQITRRLTLAASSRGSAALLVEAKALLGVLEGQPEGVVSDWLSGLRNQPGSVHALCAAERALLSDSSHQGRASLGEVLEAWTDIDVLDGVVRADEEAGAYTEERAPDRRKPHVVRIYAPGHPSSETSMVQLRMRIHPNPMADSMLWSERAMGDSDPVALAVALAAIDNVVEYLTLPRPAQLRTGPLDRFHPERFITQHPSARALGSLARARTRDKQSGLTMDDFNRVQEAVAKDAQSQLFELPLAVRHSLPALGSAPIAQAASLAAHLVMWMTAGRQIYDLPPALVERFKQTDVDDVPLPLLKFPYEGLYLYWGPQADLELEPGWLIDGAYVMTGVPGVLQLVVTAAPTDPVEGAWWSVKGEPYYFQAFEQDTLGMDVGTAVDTVLSKELAELRQRIAKPAMDVDATLHELVASGEVDPARAPKHVEDVSARTATQEWDRVSRRHAVYVASLKLVVNALCYLTAYPEDSIAEFPTGAPQHLVKSAESTDFKTAKSARGRLAELGYLPVHLCGKELASMNSMPVPEGHVRAHWRRGHWRRQPYGEGRALRKLIWVMPMLVGAGDKDEPLGHLYLVS